MVLGPGETIDRYKIIRLLGTGGMGHVYEARDPKLLRNVGLKVLHLEKSQRDAVGHHRLLHEARLAASLEHPNVVAVYDVGEIQRPGDGDTTMYLAMELIAGRSLREYVGDRAVTIKERVRILRDVATALAAAHARGMVHRDVKPENVMVREDGVVKVLDFGIAKRDVRSDEPPSSEPAPLVPTTAEGVTVGTPYYMAPEQMRGEAIDGRADQFAWAVVAYELFAGELPWTPGSDSLQIVAQVLSRDPPLLTTKSTDVPVALAAVVMRALAKSRELRFETMNALIAAMDSEGSAPSVATERGPARAGTASGSTASATPISTAAAPNTLDPALAATQGAWGTPALGAGPAPRKRRRMAVALVSGALVLSVAIGALVLVKPSSATPGSETAAPSMTSAPAPPVTLTSPAPPVSAQPSTSIASAPSALPPARPTATARPTGRPIPPSSPSAGPSPAPSPTPSPYDHL